MKTIKKKILIKGDKVHNVGYRLFLMNMAEDCEIGNFDAKNVKENGKEVVFVLVESSERNVEEFLNIAKENFPEHSVVESIYKEDCISGVKSLDSFRSGFMAEQQHKFVNVGLGLRNEMNEFRNETKESFDSLNKETRGLRTETKESFDSLNKETRGLRTETNENFRHLDTKYDVISQNMNGIFEELVKERHELRKSMERERKESRKSMEKLVDAILQSKSGN